jgi:helicase
VTTLVTINFGYYAVFLSMVEIMKTYSVTKQFYCGISGQAIKHSILMWEDIGLTNKQLEIAKVLAPNSLPRPIQKKAIENGLMSNRWHTIVSAPTNSGKSIVGLLPLFEAIEF